MSYISKAVGGKCIKYMPIKIRFHYYNSFDSDVEECLHELTVLLAYSANCMLPLIGGFVHNLFQDICLTINQYMEECKNMFYQQYTSFFFLHLLE